MRFGIMLALCATLVALATPALAIDNGPDSFGVYFDRFGYSNQKDLAEPNSVVTAYLILANPTALSVQGWEVFLNYGGLLPLGVTYRGMDPLNMFSDLDKFCVGLAYPMIPEPETVLASVQLLVPDGEPRDITAGPIVPASFPGRPCYVSATNLSQMIPMNFATVSGPQNLGPDGWTLLPLATVNGNAPIATEPATWGGVKALFE